MKFRDKYYFLSNMYPCNIRITLCGMEYTFKSVEAAFQANKCPSRADEFKNIDGFAAKALGRKVSLRTDWENKKEEIMLAILQAKFTQNPDLYTKLKAVNGHITEENAWGDKYWGACDSYGKNRLGVLLMKVRDAA